MLAFNVVDHPDLRIVNVGGEIDGTNADAFELACTDSEGKRIVVDLLTCPYIDSTGLTALIKASHRNTLTIVLQPTCRIYRIFAITELLSYFTIASTLSEAIGNASLSAGVSAPLTESGSPHSFA